MWQMANGKMGADSADGQDPSPTPAPQSSYAAGTTGNMPHGPGNYSGCLDSGTEFANCAEHSSVRECKCFTIPTAAVRYTCCYKQNIAGT